MAKQPTQMHKGTNVERSVPARVFKEEAKRLFDYCAVF